MIFEHLLEVGLELRMGIDQAFASTPFFRIVREELGKLFEID